MSKRNTKVAPYTYRQQLAFIRRWAKALRSGKYKQGKTSLNENGKFCCLGVACDLFVKSHPGAIVVENDGQEVSYNGETTELPNAVVDVIGFVNACGRTAFSADDLATIKGEELRDLASLNDEGKSFKAIAYIIEKRTDDLFNLRKNARAAK